MIRSFKKKKKRREKIIKYILETTGKFLRFLFFLIYDDLLFIIVHTLDWILKLLLIVLGVIMELWLVEYSCKILAGIFKSKYHRVCSLISNSFEGKKRTEGKDKGCVRKERKKRKVKRKK